jgi:hypothetical protein
MRKEGRGKKTRKKKTEIRMAHASIAPPAIAIAQAKPAGAIYIFIPPAHRNQIPPAIM